MAKRGQRWPFTLDVSLLQCQCRFAVNGLRFRDFNATSTRPQFIRSEPELVRRPEDAGTVHISHQLSRRIRPRGQLDQGVVDEFEKLAVDPEVRIPFGVFARARTRFFKYISPTWISIPCPFQVNCRSHVPKHEDAPIIRLVGHRSGAFRNSPRRYSATGPTAGITSRVSELPSAANRLESCSPGRA